VIQVQTIGEAKEGAKLPHQLAICLAEPHVVGVMLGGQSPAVVARDVPDDEQLARAEPLDLRVPDDVERVLVMRHLSDRGADIVEQPSLLQ